MICDVLVVGAGPAGLSAALNCAKKGLNIILIEKNEVIGSNVKTSGHTFLVDLGKQFDISKDVIAQRLNSFYLHSLPLNESVEVTWNRDVLCTLNHYIFLQVHPYSQHRWLG